MVLYINTASKVNRVELRYPSGKKDILEWEEEFSSSEKLLKKIDQLLKKHNIKPQDLKRVSANPGPGTFTGTRVGVSVANAIGWSLEIPDYPIQPVYKKG